MKKRGVIRIFTDGACSMNKTWSGGWAYLIYMKGRNPIIRSGYEYKTTNNRMEVMAILYALSDIRDIERKRKVKYRVEIISDSGYAVFPFIKYGWVAKWRAKRFDRHMLNYDLWKELMPLVIYFGGRLKFTHIRGHGKNPEEFYNHYNDIVDKQAVEERLYADSLV